MNKNLRVISVDNAKKKLKTAHHLLNLYGRYKCEPQNSKMWSSFGLIRLLVFKNEEN